MSAPLFIRWDSDHCLDNLTLPQLRDLLRRQLEMASECLTEASDSIETETDDLIVGTDTQNSMLACVNHLVRAGYVACAMRDLGQDVIDPDPDQGDGPVTPEIVVAPPAAETEGGGA